ncbi:MAG: hypothetical protein EOO56_04205 [Hymenobacter sp.]|nr:MAG: hypothetical protein EOO56_04205 [Hymenobacter sp.]
MFKLPLLCALLSLSYVPAKKSPWFSGCIVYENEYKTLAGETLYFAAKTKNWFYVQGSNAKMYDRNKKLVELYRGKKNEFYTFEKGQAVLRADTARRAAPAAFEHLPTTTIILGYPCQAIHLVDGSVSTLVYYSAAVRVNAANFSRCAAPGWAALLQATHGALPLRTVYIDAQHDVTATSEAISVQAMKLAATDFTATAPAR